MAQNLQEDWNNILLSMATKGAIVIDCPNGYSLSIGIRRKVSNEYVYSFDKYIVNENQLHSLYEESEKLRLEMEDMVDAFANNPKNYVVFSEEEKPKFAKSKKKGKSLKDDGEQPEAFDLY
jgi:hypothetical protein